MNTSRSSDLPLDPPGDDGRWGFRPFSARVVPLARYAVSADTATHLAEVDALLSDVLADLLKVWTEDLDDPGAVDVLGRRDLPVLLQQLLQSGGKRIRPAMCYLGWLSAHGTADGSSRAGVVRVGAALELLHVFALIHDDVMDESASRRGQPSVHTQAARMHAESGARGSAQRFGESIAVLVGDLAHAEADHLASALPAEMRNIWRILVIELVCGQRRDLTGSVAGRRDLHHARQVARMKSGSYTVERPLQLGAAAASASAPMLSCLRSFGREMGDAFALRDDLLGVWGDPAVTGKPAGDDLLSGKPTVVLALAQQRLRGTARAVLDRIGSPSFTVRDVGVLQHALAGCGVIDAVEGMIGAHLGEALAALENDVLHPDGIAGLTQLAHQIAWRDR